VEGNGADYALAGVPNTLYSTDVVHVRQWAIAAGLKQVATGKEKVPTRAYEVSVNRRKLVRACTIDH